MFPPPRKRVQNKRGRSYRQLWSLLAIVLAVAAVVTGVYFLFFRQSGQMAAKELRFTPAAKYAVTDSTLYYIEGDTLSCVTYSDVEKWSATLPAQGMNVAASPMLVAAFDQANVAVYSATGQALSNTQFYGKVTQVRCGETLTAVLSYDYENVNRVIVLDKTGAEAARYAFEDKFIIDFGFYNGDSLYIYTVDNGTGLPLSRLMTYNAALSNTGNLSVENQLLQHASFLSTSLYAVGTNQLIKMDYIGAVQEQKLIYGWEYRGEYIDERAGKTVFVFVPGGDSGGKTIPTARVVVPGEADVYLQMKTGVIDVAVTGRRLYAFTETQVHVYDLKGKHISTRDLPFAVRTFSLLPGGEEMLCATNEAVYLVTLP